MSKIEPARSLVLTTEQHTLLGELAEIMGLIESLLIDSVEQFDAGVAGKLRKLTASPQAEAWATAIRGRVSDPAISVLIPAARTELVKLAEDRNDFIHALYENDYVDGYVEPGYQTTSATRSKTGISRPTADLQSIRDRAATLSCKVDAIGKAVV
jgi:hypothetical protein